MDGLEEYTITPVTDINNYMYTCPFCGKLYYKNDFSFDIDCDGPFFYIDCCTDRTIFEFYYASTKLLNVKTYRSRI